MSALDGIRVIDFGQFIAGPLAGMLLADQGAEVIRVDPPGGPRLATPANAVWNRGKRSIVLDLKGEEGRDTAARLVRTADVVIENFRPGVMDRLGLGAEATMAENPSLIYCSLPGFAADDPRAGVQAWEGVVEAAAGAYGRIPRPERPGASSPVPDSPIFSAIPISSSYAAFLGVVGITMALHARDRDGVGQRVEVPMFDATFTAMGYRAQRLHNPSGDDAAGINLMAWMGEHECSDGRWVFFHVGNKNAGDFVDAVGAREWAEEPGAPARVDELFRTKTALEWEQLGEQVGTEMVVCHSSAEWLAELHARRSNMVVEVEDRRYGRMLQPGVNARLLRTPGAIRTPAPAPDADREDILASLTARRPPSSPAAAPEGLLRPVLDGVKVLDLCIVLAGPTCGRTLAEYGADVIKIDGPPRPRGLTSTPPATNPTMARFNMDVNRGKRSIVVDLKMPEGIEVFWKLAEDADVIVQNFREGIAERLGIGYDEVVKRHPNIVYASLNTYGFEGPWRGRPGHEQLAQSATGMSVRYGAGGRPVLQNVGALNDYGTGLMGAYAVALGLWHLRRTGEGQHVNTGLAYTSCTLQSLFMHDYEGKTWTEPSGQDALGYGPLQRLFQTSDGWLFLGVAEDDRGVLEEVEGLAGSEGLRVSALEKFLEERLTLAPTEMWVKRLTAAGVGVHAVTRVGDLLDDPWIRAHGIIIGRDHEGVGQADIVGTTSRLSRTPPNPGRTAVVPGSDGREILEENGLGDEVGRLVAAGAVHLRD